MWLILVLMWDAVGSDGSFICCGTIPSPKIYCLIDLFRKGERPSIISSLPRWWQQLELEQMGARNFSQVSQVAAGPKDMGHLMLSQVH